MGGIQRGDEHIYVTHLPTCKKPVLAVGNKCVITKIASFDSEEYAEGFYKMLCKWFGLEQYTRPNCGCDLQPYNPKEDE